MTQKNLKFFQRKNFIALMLLLIAGSVTFYPVLENDFTNWDDQVQLVENPQIRELSLSNLKNIFTTSVVSEYHPLVTAIFSLEYRLVGMNPHAYHLHSLIIHLINGCLVFFLILRLCDRIQVALVAALFFLVHPLQVQAVAWISARKDLVFTLFFLLSLLAFFRYCRRGKRVFYYLSFLFFIAAILSKTLAVTVPVVLFIWLLIYRRPELKHESIGLLPYLAVSLAAGFLALSMQTVRLPGSAAHLDFSFTNVALLLRNLDFYVVRLLFPFNLSPVYIFPESLSIRAAPVLRTLLLISVLALWFRQSKEARKIILWSVGFFLITIFPVLRFIPFGGIEITANRFDYLPSIGIFFLTGFGIYALRYAGRNRRLIKMIVTLSTVAVIIFLCVMSRDRCRIWEDGGTLWEEAIARQEESDLLYHMLADSCFRVGRYEETIERCDKAIALNPAMAYSYLLKSRAQESLGRTQASSETRRQYNEVLLKLGITR